MQGRWNTIGLPREDLLWALGERRIIKKALEEGACLLCKGTPVNEAALCDICWALLSEQELIVATKWVRGDGP